jgi:3-isopropylmalate/(R)-2-methylmalate dehydratase large subunit
MNCENNLFNKIWENHVVIEEPGSPAVLYVDLHLVHEVTSPQAFSGLRERGLKVHRPDKTIATADHSTPTTRLDLPFLDKLASRQVRQLEDNCREFGIPLYGVEHPQRGIVHVIGPELGLTQPGMTIVCGDSHTSTHGAFGALAFGIGTSEVEHVLATQCLLQHKPKTCRIQVEGCLIPGVSAKDLILSIIAKIGVDGGTGYVFEYTGPAIRALSMEERMTVCNMSIEAGARAGLIAPDDTTFQYLDGRPFTPQGRKWDLSLKHWKQLSENSDHPVYGKTVYLEADTIEPTITYGTNPGMSMGISGCIPDPDSLAAPGERAALAKSLAYMGLQPGNRLLGHPIDAVFIGSCTNGRIEDLRAAARLLEGRKTAQRVRILVVPGSAAVKQQAEAEGLDKIFISAGAEWRQPGCSMCIAMNGDQLEQGEYAVSTSNRNFEGRQGKRSRTFLASPLTAAASAVAGCVADPRSMMEVQR